MFSLGIARGNRRFSQQPTAVSRAVMKVMELHTNSVTWDNKLQLEIEAWEIQAGYLQEKKKNLHQEVTLENLEEVKSPSFEVFRMQLDKTRAGPMAVVLPQEGC